MKRIVSDFARESRKVLCIKKSRSWRTGLAADMRLLSHGSKLGGAGKVVFLACELSQPTADWISHQLTEGYGWKVAPRYIIRDRDAVYGDVFIRRLPAMSIRDRLTAPRSPWQNGYCERAIGSIRWECLDHVVVFGKRHLPHLLRSYATYYNEARTHLSVNKDAPSPRTVHGVAFCLRHFSADFIICTREFTGYT